MAGPPAPKYPGFGLNAGSGRAVAKRPPKILRGKVKRMEANIVTLLVIGTIIFFALLYIVYRCTEFGCRLFG